MPTNAPEAMIALVSEIRVASDGVRIVLAECQTCWRTVCHGVGPVGTPPDLGQRLAHCGCRTAYELVLTEGVVIP